MELSKEELIQAAVLLHPTYVTVDDIKGKVTFCTFKTAVIGLVPWFMPYRFHGFLQM